MKILFLTLHDKYQASSQVRVYQFLPYLQKMNIDCRTEPLIPTKKRSENKFIWLSRIFVSLIKRYIIIARAGQYDIIFVQSDVLPFGLRSFLKIINPNIIFEFDDAIWEMAPQHQERNIFMRLFYKYQIRLFYKIIKNSKAILVENSYLASYASKFNDNVCIVTAPIDTDSFRPASE